MSPDDSWLRFSMDSWWLGIEAAMVIGLRIMTIAAGGSDAQAEAHLMVSEKIDLGWTLQTQMLTGALGGTPAAATHRAMAQLLRKVSDNRARLSRPSV